MSTVTNRFCPHCFRRLNEGVKDWLWCPDTYICEYECDISKNDTTLSERQAQLAKLDKLESNFEDHKKQYELERVRLLYEIENLKSKISA